MGRWSNKVLRRNAIIAGFIIGLMPGIYIGSSIGAAFEILRVCETMIGD